MRRPILLLVLPLIALATMGNTQQSLTRDCIAAYGALFGPNSTTKQTVHIKRVYDLRQKLCVCFVAELLLKPEMDADGRRWLQETFAIMKTGNWNAARERERSTPPRLKPIINPTGRACTRRIMK